MALPERKFWFRPGRNEKSGRKNPGILAVDDKYEYVAHDCSRDKLSWTYVCKYRKTCKVNCLSKARVVFLITGGFYNTRMTIIHVSLTEQKLPLSF